MADRGALAVNYDLRVRDFVSFTAHRLWKSGSVRFRFYVMWLVMPVGLLAAALFVWSRFQFELAAATLAAIAALILLFYPTFHQAGIINYALAFTPDVNLDTLLAQVELKLTDRSLIETLDGVRTEAEWQQVRGVESAGDQTYIHLANIQTVIVPRAGFVRDDDYAAVRAFVYQRLGKPLPEE